MITMDKKYRRNGEDGAVISTTAAAPWSVVWQSDSGEIHRYTNLGSADIRPGYPSLFDLIEVVPEVVTYRAIFPDASLTIGYASPAKVMPCLNYTAIIRTTIRNGGVNGHTDVTVDVLPVDYKETP
jgi:hypothetical protein